MIQARARPVSQSRRVQGNTYTHVDAGKHQGFQDSPKRLRAIFATLRCHEATPSPAKRQQHHHHAAILMCQHTSSRGVGTHTSRSARTHHSHNLLLQLIYTVPNQQALPVVHPPLHHLVLQLVRAAGRAARHSSATTTTPPALRHAAFKRLWGSWWKGFKGI